MTCKFLVNIIIFFGVKWVSKINVVDGAVVVGSVIVGDGVVGGLVV